MINVDDNGTEMLIQNNSQEFRTSNTGDGCHFVGYMSRQIKVESAIGCEGCHGPGSNHSKILNFLFRVIYR